MIASRMSVAIVLALLVATVQAETDPEVSDPRTLEDSGSSVDPHSVDPQTQTLEETQDHSGTSVEDSSGSSQETPLQDSNGTTAQTNAEESHGMPKVEATKEMEKLKTACEVKAGSNGEVNSQTVVTTLRVCTEALEAFSQVTVKQHSRSKIANDQYVAAFEMVLALLQKIKDIKPLLDTFSADQKAAMDKLMRMGTTITMTSIGSIDSETRPINAGEATTQKQALDKEPPPAEKEGVRIPGFGTLAHVDSESSQQSSQSGSVDSSESSQQESVDHDN